MKISLIAMLAAVLCLGSFVRAEDKKDVKMTGVLIDQMCAAKMEKKEDPQKAAAGHDKACALKCGGDAGYAIMSDGKTTKLSDDSKAKVEEYLKKDDSKTAATIEGTKAEDGTITVTSIAAAEEKK
jgi:endonuclease YncB( thermonuclease family)